MLDGFVFFFDVAHDNKADSNQLLAAFLHVLPNFVNVREFNCQVLTFDNFAMTQLCKLTNLRTIDLDGSSVTAATLTPAALRLHNLTYTTGNSNDTNIEQDKTNVQWLAHRSGMLASQCISLNSSRLQKPSDM
jgi:hypothetical protein